MNSYDLAGRVAVVTGGAQGIGKAIVERFLASGATVEIWDIDGDLAQSAASTLGPKTTARAVDVSSFESVEAASKAAQAQHGRVDILVTSAGIAGPTATTWDYPLADWSRVMRINVDGTFHCCKAIVPGMIERNFGRIIMIASIAGKEGNPKAPAYSASKAAVIALTKSLGKELAGHDIAVNCVTPVTAATRILDQVTPDFVEYMRSKIPRGRFITVEEIASTVAFMASADNSFTTAGVFDLSGGRATY